MFFACCLERCHHEVRTWSVILINKNISKDVWRIIPTHSPNVTALEIKGNFGKIQIYNMYNDGTHNKTLENLDNLFTELDSSGNETHANGILLMGDFNRHHPMWDEPHNQHLFTAANLHDAQPLLDLLVTYDLIMALPEGIPTLEANGTGNHTRPDNVFCMSHLQDAIDICDVTPDLRPTGMDHYPIIMEISLCPECTNPVPKEKLPRHKLGKVHEAPNWAA